MEFIDVVDENGIPTGEVVEREYAHSNGIRHRTSHVWVVRFKKNIRNKEKLKNGIMTDPRNIEILLQKRSEDKDSNPGLWDISSAGHIQANDTYVNSALRELKEELGISAASTELKYCGKKHHSYQRQFHEKTFWDDQVSNVYLLYRDVEKENIHFQKTEISDVMWMSFEDVMKMVTEDETFENTGDYDKKKSCIQLQEMNILKSYICDQGIQEKKKRLTTLCYIEKDEKYLMLYRNKKKNDQSEGKWLGVGGKLEQNESPDECMIREVLEETGLKVKKYNYRGMITFISDVCEEEIMFLYTVCEFENEIKKDCDEGKLEWISKSKIMKLPMWEGDKIFLKELINNDEFINLKLTYVGDKLISSNKYVEKNY